MQIGRGRFWPGTHLRRSPAARALLLGLNVIAVVAAPVVLDQLDARTSYATTYSEPVHQTPSGTGLRRPDGSFLENLYPYDADGRPLL